MTSPGLRFAMITTFYPPHHFGGDAGFVRLLGHALARRGHRVEVIHDVDAFRMLAGGVEPEPLPEPAGVRVHGLRSRLGPLSCLATQQLGRPVVQGRRIRRILREGGFDVIHFHNVSLVGGPGILACGDGIKLYTAHEHWLVCPTHALWRHDRELCTGRQCLRCTLHHRRPPQVWRGTGLLERMARHVDAFCSPSRFSAEKHREFGFARDFDVLPPFLPDRVPGPEAPRGPADEAGERPLFLFVGRLEKIKGLQEVIPLFDDDAPADLWIAGAGSHEGPLRRLAEGRRRVRFLGFLRAEALPSLYARARALLVPSLCYEVFPMVVLEAFREGTPVVARRLGPFPEIVEQSGGGLLFDSTDDLREALWRLAGDAPLGVRLGEAARQAFRERWSEDAGLERYFSLIRRIARRRGAGRVLEILGTGP